MPNWNVRTLFILGAGFSYYAGLPLTDEFTDALLEARAFSRGPSKTLVEFLGIFIHDVFGHKRKALARHWPSLEDIFTCIDLSANTGHHLGERFSPADLRTVRRALVARIIRMLHQRYELRRKAKGIRWRDLNNFFEHIDPTSVGFIVTNWDTVVERRLAVTYPDILFDYCCEALAAEFPSSPDPEYPTQDKVVRLAALPISRARVESAVPLVKMHGSVNWLYCDNCRELFWFHPDESWRIAEQLVQQGDWARIREVISSRLGRRHPTSSGGAKQCLCPCSDKVPLGTRIATFSYRKALDFPMFQKSWLSAEKLLRNADRWIFIGYSLPAADYEFKYLLKRTQVSRRTGPDFLVVAGGKPQEIENTYSNYQRFFGRAIHRKGASRNFFARGLSDEAVDRMAS
jgi:hypothetical protein